MTEKSLDTKKLWTIIAGSDDHKSFEKFYTFFNSRLIKFCELYVHKREVAEELVADVFVSLWSRRLKILEVENLEKYLFISVKNRALNHLRKNAAVQIVQIEDSHSNLASCSNPANEIEHKELIIQLDQAIETLPHQCKIVFKLVKNDGLKYKEVGEKLNISHKTVQTQILRAVKKLTEKMHPHLPVKSLNSSFAFTILFAL